MKKSGFVDEVCVTIASGRGGDGCVHFYRGKFEPRGGPDGGDGGRGGNVIFIADRNRNTLLEFARRRHIEAEAGRPGEVRSRHGAAGRDIEVRVPVGTVFYESPDTEADTPVADLRRDGDRFHAARGGRGGWGNPHFATSTRQAPDFAKPGLAGETRTLELRLKLLADVGLLGLPNAGKSTLLGRISAAKPAVANYPFTTLVPALGVVEVDERRFIVADLPGLIAGASEGVGLGDRFLRHVERTRVLLHLLDVGGAWLEDRDPFDDYRTLRNELGLFDPELLGRSELVVLNKVDLVSDRQRLAALRERFEAEGCRVFAISGATGEGVDALMQETLRTIDAAAEIDTAKQDEASA